MTIPKYARIEYERRFLVDIKTDWRAALELYSKRLDDRYLACGRLRLRRLEDSDTRRVAYKFTKKYESDSLLAQPVVNTWLSESEFGALSGLDGFSVSKTRHYQTWNGVVFAVDVFHGELDDLVLCESEQADSIGELLAIQFPPYAKWEVTENPNFTGGHLCRMSGDEMRSKVSLMIHPRMRYFHSASAEPPLGGPMNKQQFALATLTLTLATAQPVTYLLMPATGVAPSPRYDGAIVYDPAGKQAFVFGGQDAQSTRNDLWSYSFADKQWTASKPDGLAPQARFGHTLIYDSARRRVILFGGQSGGFLSDVWAYDIVSTAWKQLAPDSAGPSRRYGHSAIYETARDRMVISHGFTDAGRFDDTWAFDFKTNAWTNISPAQNRPLRRCLHHAAYDAASGQMYLYGGCSSGFGPCPQADLWSFDLAKNSWTELTPKPSPAGRDHYGMAFDETRAKLVVFGGQGASTLNDTWEYDPKLRTWQPAMIEGTPPAARSRHEAAFAIDQGAVLFFGGSTAAGLSAELWSLTLVKPPVKPVISMVLNSFSLTGGAIAPGELLTIQGSNLGPDGLSVTVNGFAAPVLTATADEIRLQAPYELDGADQAKIVVSALGAQSEPAILPLAPTKPGLAMAILNEDGSANTVGNPALAGSVVTLRVTGHGVTVPATPTGALPQDGVLAEPAASSSVTIGGQNAEILSRRQSPDSIGVLLLQVRVAPDYSAADPGATVIVTVGAESASAQPVSIAVAALL